PPKKPDASSYRFSTLRTGAASSCRSAPYPSLCGTFSVRLGGYWRATVIVSWFCVCPAAGCGCMGGAGGEDGGACTTGVGCLTGGALASEAERGCAATGVTGAIAAAGGVCAGSGWAWAAGLG